MFASPCETLYAYYKAIDNKIAFASEVHIPMILLRVLKINSRYVVTLPVLYCTACHESMNSKSLICQL